MTPLEKINSMKMPFAELKGVTFTEAGNLPSGVSFSSMGQLSGTPLAGTGGTYPVAITASNGVPSCVPEVK